MRGKMLAVVVPHLGATGAGLLMLLLASLRKFFL